MKIIQEKHHHIKQVTCDICWSTIEYDIVKDIKERKSHGQFEVNVRRYIECPVCDSDIEIVKD